MNTASKREEIERMGCQENTTRMLEIYIMVVDTKYVIFVPTSLSTPYKARIWCRTKG